MGVLRWPVGVLIFLYALQALFAATSTTGLKFGWVTSSAEMQRLLPLAQAISVVQLAAWWASIVLFFVSAWNVIRGIRTLPLYALAFVLDVGNWLLLKLGGVYDRTFTARELKFDYLLLVLLMMLGATIWYVEGAAPRKARA